MMIFCPYWFNALPAIVATAALSLATAAYAKPAPKESLIRASEASQQRWSQYFASVPKVPDPHGTIHTLLAVPSACAEAVKMVFEAVDGYARAVYYSEQNKADWQHERITRLLGKLEKAGDPCFLPAARAYPVASIATLNVEDYSFELASPPYTGEGIRISDTFQLNLLMIALYNQGRIEVITDSFRKAQKDPLWRENGPHGPLVVGAYGCEEGRIYIDPRQRPIDLGTSLAHELGHLLRDKLVPDSSLTAGGHGSKGATLLDEAISVLESAALQRGLFVWKLARKRVGFGPFKEWEDRRSYDIQGDITLFERGGPLSQLWVGLGQDKVAMFTPSRSDNFLKLALLRSEATEGLAPELQERLFEIWKTISTAYFGEALSLPDLGKLSPELAPLSRSLRQLETRTDDLGQDWRVEIEDYSTIATRKNGKVVWETKPSSLNLDIFFDFLDDLTERLSSPSGSCTAFIDALDAGDLDQYVGRKLSVPNDPSKRPGPMGVRPGPMGVRPGPMGVRPVLFMKPCLNFKHAL